MGQPNISNWISVKVKNQQVMKMRKPWACLFQITLYIFSSTGLWWDRICKMKKQENYSLAVCYWSTIIEKAIFCNSVKIRSYKCTNIRIPENLTLENELNHECLLVDLLWLKSKIKKIWFHNSGASSASADTPLGQWFSNYHDPKKEKTQYSNETYSYFL